MSKAMNAKEFVSYWLGQDEEGRTPLSYLEESIAECSAEYANECAMFGDAGVGQGAGLIEMKRDHLRVVNQLRRLGAM